MEKNLCEIAKQLKENNKEVQLIYAFNGTGKTRLSREFKKVINDNLNSDIDDEKENKKIIYYNAFTEDLFYWDNDIVNYLEPKLKIHRNEFTKWIFEKQGQEVNVIDFFQYYTDDKLTPHFNSEYIEKDNNGHDTLVPAFSEITFSYERGNDDKSSNVKISKGEESCLIWSVFYALIEQIVSVLNVADEDYRETDDFNDLEYIFIDDPVTSLDDNHLIQMATDLASLINRSKSNLKFIITTHSPVFFNVIYNELNKPQSFLLNKHEDNTYSLIEKKGDSNKSFFYHLHLKNIIETAIKDNQIERYHFTVLRNLYEKTSSFLGYQRWKELLPDDKQLYYSRIIQFTSHSFLDNISVSQPTNQEKETVKFLFNHLIDNYSFYKKEK